jgi:hypothetical protein
MLGMSTTAHLLPHLFRSLPLVTHCDVLSSMALHGHTVVVVVDDREMLPAMRSKLNATYCGSSNIARSFSSRKN